MEIILTVISVCSIASFTMKTATFLTDEYKIYKQISQVKNVCCKVLFPPKMKEIYYCEPYGDDGIIIHTDDWILVEK